MIKEGTTEKKLAVFARIAAAVVCLLMTVSIGSVLIKTPDASAVSQSEVDRLKNNLESITAQRKELEAELKNLNNQQATMTAQIEALDKKIAAAEEEIDVQLQLIDALKTLIEIKETELKEAEKKRDLQYDLMRTRVRYMAEHGSVSYLSVLLSADSFSDFLTRYEVVKSIIEHDNSVFDSFRAACDEVEEQKISLQKSHAEAEAQEKRLEENKAKMESELAQREAKMEELARVEAETRKEYNTIAAEEDKLIEQIRDAVNELAKQNNSGYVGGKFQWPLPAANNIVTCVYGMRVHPITGVYKLHTGVDLRASSGTKIYAANSGTVITSTYSTAYGNYVVIEHGGGVATLYAHMTKRLVSVGQKVTQGQQIGTVGSTGYSTAPHLHFEIIKDGDYVDPVTQFPGFRIVFKDGKVLSN